MVTVYTQPGCQPCRAVYRKLTELGVEFDIRDVSTNEDDLKKVRELGYQQVPVVVASDGSHWYGYVPDKLESLV